MPAGLPAPPNRLRRLVKPAVAIAVALAAYGLLECGYRLHVYRYHVGAGCSVTIVDADIHAPTTGYLTPNLDFHWRQFNAQHELMCDAHVKTNAQGFISRRDYPLDKAEREFRIALIGDSFTACITNDFPWADALEDELNRDEAFKNKVGAQRVRVLNFGTPGAGFHTFAVNYVRFAERFSPDLVVVNYIEEDFAREAGGKLPDNLDALRDVPEPAMAYANVQQARIRVLGNYSDELARQYDDPLRIPGLSLSSFFVIEDDGLAFDKSRMDSIKRELAERYFRPRLWRSWQPRALYRVLGARFQLEGRPTLFAARSTARAQQVDHALEGLRAIQRRNSRLIVLRNPVHGDLTGKPEVRCTDGLQAAASDIEIVRMERHLPVEHGDDDIYKWFNLPHDGHWSNYGATLYAAAVHAALSQRLPGATTVDDSSTPATARSGEHDSRHR